MKFSTLFFVSVLVLGLLSTGCGRGAGPDKGVTSGLAASFTAADPKVQTLVDKAVAEIKSKNYEPAVRLLESLLLNQNLTPEQTQAVQATLKDLPAFPRLTP